MRPRVKEHHVPLGGLSETGGDFFWRIPIKEYSSWQISDDNPLQRRWGNPLVKCPSVTDHWSQSGLPASSALPILANPQIILYGVVNCNLNKGPWKHSNSEKDFAIIPVHMSVWLTRYPGPGVYQSPFRFLQLLLLSYPSTVVYRMIWFIVNVMVLYTSW